MKLIEALQIVGQAWPSDGPTFRLSLVAGFTPLHLQTFLTAELRRKLPHHRIEIETGLFNDFWGNLHRSSALTVDATVLFLEWSDLDPRLGLRSLGRWDPAVLPEIAANVRARAIQFRGALDPLSRKTCCAISLPTLPLLPLSFSCPSEASPFELELKNCVTALAQEASQIANVRILNSGTLDLSSSPHARLDARSELSAGFPYQLGHASALAKQMVQLVAPESPKKGLITDLDDTLWSGILGEVGVRNIHWDLENHSQLHGLYQRLLQALSESGVLLAAASKNEDKVVNEALDRTDLILPRSALFPVEANWGPKSSSVSKILKIWNIGAEAVVFVDDSPAELAEVKSKHSDLECVLFPKKDPEALVSLLYRLRDQFGKSRISEEDGIRRESIRQNALRQPANPEQDGNLDAFLASAEAELSLNYSKEPFDSRAFELVNKTNQFNLNGRRFTDSAWRNLLGERDSFLLVATYQDKFGPLGKIAVLAGRKSGTTLHLDTWVMSCRAFSRRIEHKCIEELFKVYQANEIVFDFLETPKNGPLRQFLKDSLGLEPKPKCRLSREQFLAVEEKSFQRVLEISNG
jgi:FkbH-like protein